LPENLLFGFGTCVLVVVWRGGSQECIAGAIQSDAIFPTQLSCENIHEKCRVVRKPEGKRPLITPRHRGEDSIRLDLREIGWEGVHWIHLAQDRDQ
jgi:hypothetical protein